MIGMEREHSGHDMATAASKTGRETRLTLVEHKMKLVMKISDRITVLHQGAFLAEGTPDEIRANPTVQQTYLGATR